MTNVEVIIPIAFFLTVVMIIKIVADNRMRHRLIEKGMVDEKAKYLFSDRILADRPGALKWGLVLVAIGAGVLIGQLVPTFHRDEITVACIFALAGLALILYYFIAPKFKNGNGQK